jgi:hypothetical protein
VEPALELDSGDIPAQPRSGEVVVSRAGDLTAEPELSVGAFAAVRARDPEARGSGHPGADAMDEVPDDSEIGIAFLLEDRHMTRVAEDDEFVVRDALGEYPVAA